MVIPESIDFRLLGFVRRKPPSLQNLFITLGSEAPEADESKKKLKNRAIPARGSSVLRAVQEPSWLL